MIKFNDLEIGQTVYIYVPEDVERIGCDDNGWLPVKINTLISDRAPNPGRELIEVTSPWLEGGWEMVEPDKNAEQL